MQKYHRRIFSSLYWVLSWIKSTPFRCVWADEAHGYSQRLKGRKRNTNLPLFRFELFTDDLLSERVSKGGLEKDKYKHEVAKGLFSFRGVKNTSVS